MAKTIYLPHAVANKFTLGSSIYQIKRGKKTWYRVIAIADTGYKSKNTHTKFTVKKQKREKWNT